MALDPRIILAGQQPNIVNALSQGNQAAAQTLQMRDQNKLRDLYATQGAGIAAGDQNALNALAGIDPQAALGVQESRLGMENTRQTMDIRQQTAARLSREEQRAVEERAAAMSAAERAAEAKQIEDAVKMGLMIQTPEEWDRMAQQNAPHLVGQFANREALAAKYMSVAEVLTQMQGGGGPTVGAQEILEDGTIIQSTSAGPRVFGPDGTELRGQKAADAVRAAQDYNVSNQRSIYNARETGKLTGQSELGAEAESAKEAGKQAIKISGENYESYGKIRTNIRNIDSAISALDNGARAGAVDKMLPNITEASATLSNAMDRMGLDIISATTFGALSEGELKLAMETAVPRDLDEPALRSWLVKRKDAQEKVSEMLLDAAQFLGTKGNTLEMWIEKKRQESGGGGVANDGTLSPEAQSVFDKYATQP